MFDLLAGFCMDIHELVRKISHGTGTGEKNWEQFHHPKASFETAKGLEYRCWAGNPSAHVSYVAAFLRRTVACKEKNVI